MNRTYILLNGKALAWTFFLAVLTVGIAMGLLLNAVENWRQPAIEPERPLTVIVPMGTDAKIGGFGRLRVMGSEPGKVVLAYVDTDLSQAVYTMDGWPVRMTLASGTGLVTIESGAPCTPNRSLNVFVNGLLWQLRAPCEVK